MNTKLIQEFSQKAAAFALSKVPIQNNILPKEYFDHYDLKFAEYLVNECANICNNFKFTDEGPSETAAYQRTLCSVSIKEHFGLTSKGPISSRPIR